MLTNDGGRPGRRPHSVDDDPQSVPPPCPDCGATHAATGLTHRDGCPVGAAIDAQLDTDRAWFDAHPLADHYYRELLPGDLGMATLSCVLDSGRVRVQRVAPGVRARVLPPVTLAPGLDADQVMAVIGAAPEAPDALLALLDGDPA